MNSELLLTATEWHLMECLWDHAPRTGREAIEYMKKSKNWSRSTTLTMLRRMSEKGLIDCREDGEVRRYYPLVRREDAVTQETDSFVDRVYRGSISMLMSAITKKQALSQSEIDELYAILQKAEEEQKHD